MTIIHRGLALFTAFLFAGSSALAASPALKITDGGTGATNAADARTALGIGIQVPAPCTGLFVGLGTTAICRAGGVSQPIEGIFWFQNRITTPISGNAVVLTAASIFNSPSLNIHGGNYVGAAFSSTANSTDNGAFTTITATANIGDQSAVVASTTGFLVGDYLSIELDNGNIFPAIATAVDSVNNVIYFTGYAFPSVASAGKGFFDPKGHFAPLISNGIATSVATGMLAVEGGEVGTSMRTGSSSFMKCGWCIINNFDDMVHGSHYDAGLLFSSQAGTPAPTYWNTLIDISKVAGYMPVGANSWIMRADGGATVTGFFDLTNLVCSGGYEIDFRQFQVDCGGNVFANQMNYTQGENDRGTSTNFPVSGDIVIPPVNASTIILVPATNLASLTLQIGGCALGVDGHITRFSTTKAITAFSLTTLVGTFVGAPTTLAANEGHAFSCKGNTSKFYPLY